MKLADYVQSTVLKPIVAGALCAAASHLVLKDPIQKAVIFGGSAGVGIFASSLVSESISAMLPTQTGIAGMTASLETRAIEIFLGSSSVYMVDKYVTKNNNIMGTEDMMKRVAISKY